MTNFFIMVNKKKKKIGIALGCGGARGLAHLGVLKVFQEEGIAIDFIVGASMGSFIGAAYALGVDFELLEKEASTITKKKAIKELLDLAAPNRSILKGQKSRKYIEKLIGNKNFSDTKIPLYITATNLSNGEEKVFYRGSINDAIQASVSVPGIFPPVKIGKDYYIDGGVVNPTPVDVVKKLGADVVVGVDLIMQRTVKLDKPNVVTTLMQSYEIIRTQGVKYNMNKVENHAILIKPKLRGTIDSFRFYDIHKFIKAGEDAAREALPKIMRTIKN